MSSAILQKPYSFYCKEKEMDQSKAINISDTDFQSQVLESDVPVLVDFWAQWCGPCLMAAPVLEKIAQEYEGKLKVCKLNVDEARQTAIDNGIMSIPALHIFKGGRIVDQIIGVRPNYESDLKKKIAPHLQ